MVINLLIQKYPNLLSNGTIKKVFRNQSKSYAKSLINVEGSNKLKYSLQDHQVQARAIMRNSNNII